MNTLDSQGWQCTGGNIRVAPDLLTQNATTPTQFQQLLAFEALTPRVVEWQVQTELLAESGVLNSGFPPNNLGAQYMAGAYFDATSEWTYDDLSCVIAKIECGAGPNARTFFSDVRPGRFDLGVQSRVRVSVARWLRAAPGGITLALQSSIALGKGNADPPTYSCQILVPAAAARELTIPPGSLYFDFGLTGDAALSDVLSVRASANFNTFYKTSYSAAAPYVFPPSTPWPLAAGSAGLTFDNLGAAAAVVTACFWVR